MCIRDRYKMEKYGQSMGAGGKLYRQGLIKMNAVSYTHLVSHEAVVTHGAGDLHRGAVHQAALHDGVAGGADRPLGQGGADQGKAEMCIRDSGCT